MLGGFVPSTLRTVINCMVGLAAESANTLGCEQLVFLQGQLLERLGAQLLDVDGVQRSRCCRRRRSPRVSGTGPGPVASSGVWSRCG